MLLLCKNGGNTIEWYLYSAGEAMKEYKEKYIMSDINGIVKSLNDDNDYSLAVGRFINSFENYKSRHGILNEYGGHILVFIFCEFANLGFTFIIIYKLLMKLIRKKTENLVTVKYEKNADRYIKADSVHVSIK